MSVLHHESILESCLDQAWEEFRVHNQLTHEQIFDEVCEAFPYLDEDKQIEIANQRFEDLAQ